MSGPFGSQQWMYDSGAAGGGAGASLRLNTDAYLSRTPATAGNTKSWTFSCWVKKCANNAEQTIFAASTFQSDRFVLRFTDKDELETFSWRSGRYEWRLRTNHRFRDNSAWYHIVLLLNTGNAVEGERVRLYVNGERITDFFNEIYPAQNNTNTLLNTLCGHEIGWDRNKSGTASVYLDGYIAEVQLVDGTGLLPENFYENSAGALTPKKYEGSYGTNGFYLDFAGGAVDPKDVSGNGNNWTSSNVVATDATLDSPHNNFATLNPREYSFGTFGEGNLHHYVTQGLNGHRMVSSSIATSFKSGKWYAEFMYDEGVGVMVAIGVTPASTSNVTRVGQHGYSLLNNGSTLSHSQAETPYGNPYKPGDVVGVALDADAGSITWYINGVSQGLAFPSLETNIAWRFSASMERSGSTAGKVWVNFGQDSSFSGRKAANGYTDSNGVGDFQYRPPAGYLALCTANVPAPVAAIDPALGKSPKDHFSVTAYTGTGSQQSITGVPFEANWLWIKSRSASTSHQVVNGAVNSQKDDGTWDILEFDNQNAQVNTNNRIKTINPDGFTVGGRSEVNYSGRSYVAYSWNILPTGGGRYSDQSGTVSASVTRNSDLGISIMKYSQDGVSGGTVGTGLSSYKPIDMAIMKVRGTAGPYQVGHVGSSFLHDFSWHCDLDAYAPINNSNTLMGRQSSSNGSLLTFGNYGFSSSLKYYAWAFQAVDGFSNFSNYTGNGSSDGPFVYTGFRPAFVMIRRPMADGSWMVFDSVRDNYNPVTKSLKVDGSAAEGSTTSYNTEIDFLSNGFKIMGDQNEVNRTGENYMIMAFAEMPFKYANAR